MAFEAKIWVGCDEHLGIHRAVRVVANGATFAHGFVLENEWPCLVAMASRAIFVEPRHRESARRFHDVGAVRIVALDAVHFVFKNQVMIRQLKFRVGLQVALKTSGSIFPGVENKFPATATSPNMQAARAVTGLATTLPFQLRVFKMQPRMRTGVENPRDVRVALETNFVADESCAGNFRRCDDGARNRGTRVQHERHTGCDAKSCCDD